MPTLKSEVKPVTNANNAEVLFMKISIVRANPKFAVSRRKVGEVTGVRLPDGLGAEESLEALQSK
jgi:hypothetical protein